MKGFGDLYKSENIRKKKPKTSKEQIINQAIQLHLKGNINEAKINYQYCIKQGFNDQRVFSNYGSILQDLGQLEEAEKYFRKAIELQPDFAEFHCNLGSLLRDLGQLKEAEKYFRKAIKFKPDLIEAHFTLGNILKDLNKLQDAEISWRKVIELQPNFPDAHSNLAIIYKDLGKLQDSEKYFRKAIELQPSSAVAYSNLGILLKDLGKSEEAEIATRKAIELQPDYAVAHSNLGIILKSIEKLQEAEIATRKAIELQPDLVEAHSNMGNIFKDLGKLEEAERSYRKAIELRPNYAETYCNLGYLLKDLGRLEDAEISIRKAIELRPHFTAAYYILSLFICPKADDKLLKFLFSEDIFKSAENTSKSNQADIYFARGNILERKKDYEESYKMFRIGNLITRKIFQSNYRIFSEALIQDNSKSKKLKKIAMNAENLPAPIFTVGLPRAGKSTIESILSANNLVKNFGDRKGISSVVRDYRNIEVAFKILGISINSTYKEIRKTYLNLAIQHHPDKGGDEDLMAEITVAYNFLRSEYQNKPKDYRRPSLYKFFLQKLNDNLDSSEYTSHTSPNNILYTGLIASQMPKSKIIYCFRNPEDHIVELYKYNLKNYLPLKTSRIDLAKIIVLINNLMEDYKKRFHSQIYFLNYDNLILNPKREIKSILGWLNWKYDDKYLVPKLRPQGRIESKNDFHSFNKSYLNNSKNYIEMLKPVEGILSKLKINKNVR